MRTLRILVAALAMWLPLTAAADTYLLMAEEEGCMWCARWNREIAHIYPKTPEGKAAPLVRYDKRGPEPEGVALDRPVRFTPTFILVKDGAEMGRIEGYPGEDFFWGLLGMLLERAAIPIEPTTG
jgi:hypothetical protein